MGNMARWVFACIFGSGIGLLLAFICQPTYSVGLAIAGLCLVVIGCVGGLSVEWMKKG